MKSAIVHRNHSQSNQAASRVLVLVVTSFLFGIAVSSAWIWQRQKSFTSRSTESTAATLSEASRVILQRLETPVEIRLFAPAEQTDLPATQRNFAARVQQLLLEYEQAAAGKIRLTQVDPKTDAKSKSEAAALGVLPLSTAEGGVFYLGLVLACGKRNETLPQLMPEWESALESDLSRAIARISATTLSAATPPAKIAAAPTPIDARLSEELLRMFPNLQAQSFEETATRLRSNALEEFKTAAGEMQEKLQAAQRQLAAKQSGQTESEQQAAVRDFQKLQQEQSARLGEITARLQERITTLERLKGVEPHTEASR